MPQHKNSLEQTVFMYNMYVKRNILAILFQVEELFINMLKSDDKKSVAEHKSFYEGKLTK